MNLSHILLVCAVAVAPAAIVHGAETPAAVLPNVSLKPAETLNLWPGAAPGETGNIGPEHVLPNRPRPFDQITNVTVPTLAVFHPPADKRTGTGMLVIPGGGLDRLAIEVEGYEVAEWLNAQGITAFLLKYRVPARSRTERWKAGLQDAQRAMGLIRARAAEWKVDVDAIGSIGFSAGAEINVMLSTYHAEPRHYPRVDAADDLSTRPDFNIAMYGGGFTAGPNGLREDIASRINKTTPPMFIAHAFDDSAQASLILMSALKRANIPSEVHLFAAGAHGFGVRDSGSPSAAWRDLSLRWLRWQGFLDTPAVRGFARDLATAVSTDAAKPRFTERSPRASLTDAYAAQRRVVRQTVAGGGQVAGYKTAFAVRAAQTAAGTNAPAHAVLFKAGRIEATGTTPVAVQSKDPLLVETEIGYVIATDIATKLRVPRQALTTIEGIVPVIELPLASTPPPGSAAADARDGVAGNLGSNQYIVGATIAPATIPNPDALAVTLRRDGTSLHATTGAEVEGGQAQMLMTIINQIVEQGHILHRGDVVITGAIGGAKPGAKGNYTADFGALGTIAFKIE